MSAKPDPLVPADVDLRDFGYMPLDVRTLLTSSLWIKAKKDPRVAYAAVSLWCECWHQVPAASLPNDDEVLADLARCDAKEWARIKDRALLHFVECSDGRLYHRHVAQKAVESWAAKQAQRTRTAAATAAREAKRREHVSQRDVERHVARYEQRDDPRHVHQGKGREGKGTEIPSEGVPSGAVAPPQQASLVAIETAEAKPMTARERVWTIGVPLLGEGARSLLGKLAKTYGEELLASVLAEAMGDPPADPKAWVTAACERRRNAAPARANGHDKPDPRGDEEASPQWATDAGFGTRWEANNEGCYRHNAAQFRDGRKVEKAEAP